MQREGQARRGCGRFSRDSAVLKKVGGVTIPPVVARIFSGDSTSPLTREARMWCGARDSAVLGGLVWDEKWRNNPSVLTAEKFAL